jgi:hypothetical protein
VAGLGARHAADCLQGRAPVFRQGSSLVFEPPSG